MREGDGGEQARWRRSAGVQRCRDEDKGGSAKERENEVGEVHRSLRV